jgi:hypothetical protein
MTGASTTATQARLLGILRDPRGLLWSREALAERLAEEGAPAPAEAVPEAVERLIEAGRAQRVNELVAVSWRGMHGDAAADPDLAGALLLSEDASGAGVLEPVNDPDRFRGGAEGLPGRLEPISAGD